MPAIVRNTASDKPLAADIDACGLTHPGLVRKTNADHFLVASFHRAMKVHASSIDAELLPPYSPDSRGFLFLVADGVGGLERAREGSAQAIQEVSKHLLEMSEVCLETEPSRESEVVERLRSSLASAHEALITLAETTGPGTAATTLTMLIAIWPRAFVLHAGDSRAYRLRDGELVRLTVDQTMEQVMLDAGAVHPESAEAKRLRHVLVSAVGSRQLDPQVSVTDMKKGDILLLCSDGLTKHVSDDEIRERLATAASAEGICRGLVDLALERGGEDNVTVVVGKRRNA
jgi:serine/threonine protein phosphatase PrpC